MAPPTDEAVSAETQRDPADGDRPVMAVATEARRVGTRRMRMVRGVTVDSGAADNVMPRRMVRGKCNKIRPSKASRAGVHYVTASSNRIANEGETDLKFTTEGGVKVDWLFQVAEVNKVLASVSYLVDTGNRVVFDQDEETGEDISFITNKKSGVSIKMRRDRQVWVVDAYVEEDIASDFARPE